MLKKVVIVVDFQLVLFSVGKVSAMPTGDLQYYFVCVQFAIGGNKRRL